MKPEHVQGIHKRASDVVNGFAKVRDQQARDVLTLTTYIAELEHGQAVLLKRIQEFKDKAAEQPRTPNGFADHFDKVFGDLLKDFKK